MDVAPIGPPIPGIVQINDKFALAYSFFLTRREWKLFRVITTGKIASVERAYDVHPCT